MLATSSGISSIRRLSIFRGGFVELIYLLEVLALSTIKCSRECMTRMASDGILSSPCSSIGAGNK